MKNYVENHPRPQLVRDAWESLDGAWRFAFDDAGTMEQDGAAQGFAATHEITVPFTYETKMSGIGDETVHGSVWYAREITVKKDDRRVLLHFEGSDYETRVFVNGVFIGDHFGGYARFSFDITDCVSDGENTVTVHVRDSLSRNQPRGKQRWIPENFACWYVQTTGIWKSVWLEYAPAVHVESLKLTPCLKTSSVRVEAKVAGCTEGVLLRAVASFDGVYVGEVTVPVKNGAADGMLDVTSFGVVPWGVRMWSPASPDLYDLTVELIKDGAPVDSVKSYFGMREIAIQGNRVLLNGVPLYQRLILDQGYWKDSHLTPPSDAARMEDIDKVMQLGYNGVRKHQKVEDERFLYWCDVKGLLVWSEFPATYDFNDEAAENVMREWCEIVRQNYSHPSIITWTPFNESWGVPQIRYDVRQQRFTEAVYAMTKAIDPMRPVICNDGWVHTISDIITLHDYEADGAKLFERFNAGKAEILANERAFNGNEYAFAEGYGYHGQPVIISEFGGIAFDNDDSGWGYGGKVRDEAAFLARFDGVVTAVKNLDYCCGFCYTQVTDVQQEINGLMDMDRNFKINPEEIRKINLK